MKLFIFLLLLEIHGTVGRELEICITYSKVF